MIDSLRRKHAHRLIVAASKKFSWSALEESQKRKLRPVVARVLHEPDTCLQVDQFEWKHPVLNLYVLGTIMVDAGSRAASVTIHRGMDVEHGLGNVTSEIMLATLLNHWVKHCGKPDIVRTNPERAGNKSYVGGKWEGVFSGKHADTVPQETRVVLIMTQWPLATVAQARDEKENRLLPHPIRRLNRLTARDQNSQRNQAISSKNSMDKIEIPCRFEFCNSPSCRFRHPPVSQLQA